MIDDHIYQDVQMKLDEISQSNAAMKAEFRETNESIQNMKIATADLAEKLGEQQEMIGRTICGKFEWKIDNWAEIERDRRGESIYSDSFASYLNGYKMCLAI